MSAIKVLHAVYGALPGGDPKQAKAAEVTAALQAQIDRANGVVTCGNGVFGDSAPGYVKHFGAVVTRNGANYYFACQENQAIDFNVGGGAAAPIKAGPAAPDLPDIPNLGGLQAAVLNQAKGGDLQVKFAVYGALPGGDRAHAAAYDVTQVLQATFAKGTTVSCDDNTFGDSAVGTLKHFAAIVVRKGVELRFACQEGQAIDFMSGGG